MRSKNSLAVIYNSLEVFGNQIISIIITIVLARLLSPEDFGLLGMVAIFIIVSSAIIDGGFSGAIIYKKDIKKEELSTIFYINLLVAFVLYGLIYISSPFIADFYGENDLVLILRIVSISFILGSLSIVQYALYAKKMDFKTISYIRLSSQIISGIVAITYAFLGGGVWALVLHSILIPGLTGIQFWFRSNWRPMFKISIKETLPIVRYGSNLMFTSIINHSFNNIYYVLIGKYFSAAQLGYYFQANKIQKIPATKIQQVVQNSTFPHFSEIAENKKESSAYFYSTLKNALYINILLMFGLALLAEDIILWLLTEKWAASIPFIELLCFSSLLLPIIALCKNVILSQGNSALDLKIEIATKVILVLIVFISINWGISGLIIGQIIFSVISTIIYLIITHRFYYLNFFRAGNIVLSYLLIGFLPFLFLSYLSSELQFLHFLNIILYGSLYVALYFLISLIIGIENQLINKSILIIKTRFT